MVEHLNDHPNRLLDGPHAVRQDHELLECLRFSVIGAAVDNVGRRTHNISDRLLRHVLINLFPVFCGRRLGHRNGNSINRVAAQLCLVSCTVQRNHCLVDRRLVLHIHPDDGWRDHVSDVVNRVITAQAAIDARVAVAQNKRFVCADRRACRCACSSKNAFFRDNVNLSDRPALAVQNLSCFDFLDF